VRTTCHRFEIKI